MADEGFCYVSSTKGIPGAHACCVDDASHAKDSAKFCAREIKLGHIIERVPTQVARDRLGEYLKWRGQQKSLPLSERSGSDK